MNTLFSQTVGHGQNIVLLHGWAFHSGIWQFVVQDLQSEFQVTTIDLPGFGRSNNLDDSSIESIVEHILEVAPDNAIWIGWSLGGLIATKIALLHPHRVNKLICVASNPKFTKEQDWPGINIEILEKFAEQLSEDYEVTLRRFLALQFYGISSDHQMISWLQNNMFLYGKPTIAALNLGLKLLETIDCREGLKKINCSVLYLLGRLDRLVPVQLADSIKIKFPDCQTIIFPKSSHALFLTHQNEFLKQVRSFAYE